jgi:hypothetical protein
MRWPVIGAISGAAVGLGLAVWSELIDPVGYKIRPSRDVNYLQFLAAVSATWMFLGALAGAVVGLATSLLWKEKPNT